MKHPKSFQHTCIIKAYKIPFIVIHLALPEAPPVSGSVVGVAAGVAGTFVVIFIALGVAAAMIILKRKRQGKGEVCIYKSL